MNDRDPPDVLLVEDNPGDVRLTEEAFAESDAEGDLHVVGDGDEALAFCHNEGEYAEAPTPGVMLLDLNLPRKDGWELLADRQTDPTLQSIPVVVFTSSTSSSDVRRAYECGANAYLTKPVDPDAFIRRVQSFAAFWLETARLPRE